MLKLKEKLLGLWQKVLPFAQKTGKTLLSKSQRLWKLIQGKSKQVLTYLGSHRVPTTIVCSLLVMTMLMSVITVTIHQVDVYDDGVLVHTYHTADPSQSAILEKSGLTLAEYDQVTLTEEKGTVTLSIARAFPVSIEADGQTVLVMMTEGTVADALKLAALTVGGEDLLSHAETQPVTNGMVITLDRVTGDQVIKTETIDYETKKIETDELYAGETKVKQKGETGVLTKTYQVTYVNGKETQRKLVSEEVTKEPVEKIVLVGTKARKTFLTNSTAPAGYKKVLYMNCTAYSAGGTTATGRPAKWGVIAVDPNVIPLGTKVYVETPDGKYIYGTAVAADTGGAIKGNIIDICVNTRKEAYAFGRRMVNVYIY